MFTNRQKYVEKWKMIRELISCHFLVYSMVSKTNRKLYTDKILTGIAWESCQIFASGVMSGMTPPSRKWFKLTMENTDMAANSDVAKV